MKKTNRSSGQVPKMKISLCLFILFLLYSMHGFSQFNSMSYNLYGYSNAKYYTTLAVNYTGMGDTSFFNQVPNSIMMGGSVYDANANRWRPHFMYANSINCSGVDYPQPHCSETYLDANFEDERLVTMAADSADTFDTRAYLVVSVREDPTKHFPAQDKIKILKVRGYTGNGNGPGVNAGYLYSTDQIVIKDNSFIPPGQSWGNSLYPIGCAFKTVIDPGTGQLVRVLYVCGYATFENTLIPKYPDFISNKKAFIISVNVTNPASMSVIASRYFDYLPGNTNNPKELDFDIAMRAIPITSGPYANDIFLTGSVTAETGLFNGPPYVQTFVRSATMNFVLDPWTLNTVSNDHFIVKGASNGDGDNEYGMAMEEANNGLDYYIVSNTYDDKSNGGWDEGGNKRKPVWSPATHYNTGFNTMSSHMIITHANTSFMANDPAAQRIAFGLNGWALTSMGSSATPAGANPSSKTFVVGGMLHGNVPSCTHTNPINDGNITPFLWDMNVVFSSPGNLAGKVSTLSGFVAGFKAYPVGTGTGNPSTFTNTYVGFGDSNPFILWGPSFASRSKYQGAIGMANPRWLTTDPSTGLPTVYNKLQLKGTYVNKANLTLNAAGACYVDACRPTSVLNNIESIGNVNFLVNINVVVTQTSNSVSSNTSTFCYNLTNVFQPIGDCSGYYVSGAPVYKTASAENSNNVDGIAMFDRASYANSVNGGKTDIYPNPATSFVQVKLPAGLKGADLNIYVQNLMGQKIATIYNGSSDNLSPNTQLRLPSIPPGVYIVYVNSNGKMVAKEKLIVQQQ